MDTKETYTTSSGKELELPKLKYKQETLILKAIGDSLNNMPEELKRTLTSTISGLGANTDDLDALKSNVFEIISLLVTELPDQMIKVASAVTGLPVSQLEEELNLRDVIDLTVYGVRGVTTGLAGALNSFVPYDVEPEVVDEDTATTESSD